MNLSEHEARELVRFWAPQMAEHSMFLHLLLADGKLKERALEIYNRWRHFICDKNMHPVEDVWPLVQELARFKRKVLARLNAGEWLGAAYPTFVEHILRELLYFVDKLAGVKFTAEQEIAFWNTINADHASFAAGLLDPKEQDLRDKATATSKKIKALNVKDLVTALEAGVELSDFNKQAYQGIVSNTIKSVIPESLIYHVVREGQHGNKTLSALLNRPSEPVNPPHVCKHHL